MKPVLMALDTEDNSKGEIRLINFFDGEKHSTFKTREKSLAWLQKQKGARHIWATNLGYDLANLFGEYINALEITYIDSRVISAKIIGTQIYFRDTLNHWKISVAEMGKRIGLKKLGEGLDFENCTDDELIERCQRDTEITYSFVRRMALTYENIGCKLKATIGSTSLQFYSEKYGSGQWKRQFKTREIEYMLKGYYGGRTEIFFTKPVEGNIQYFDFNSLYPSVMHDFEFPVLTGAHFTKKVNLKNEGICDAVVSAPTDLHVPYLPYRDPVHGGLIFPVGSFRGFWTYFEIREALKLGYKLESIHSGFEFPSGTHRPFQAFVETFYLERMKAKASGDELLSESYKLLPNNLYGKFGQRNEVTKLLPFYSTENLKHGDTLFGNLVLRKEKGAYPAHTNVIWAAYVTAYGRHKLYGAMDQVNKAGGLLIYCDTDSVIFESDKKIFEDDLKLGGLKSEGEFKYAHFKLPKLYKLVPKKGDAKYRAKGVPRTVAKDFFEKGKAEFRRPYKLRETLRRNLNPKRKHKLIPNYWETTQKEVSKKYDKRKCNAKGFTRPIKITPGNAGRNEKIVTGMSNRN